MGTFGMDEELNAEKEKAEEKIVMMPEKKRKPFAYWNVGEREYRLKLTTEQICKLEEKYRCNLLTLLLQSSGGMPALGIMLTVLQAAMTPWEHGIKYKDVQSAFDKYVEDGGTQLTLFSDVIMLILMVSGFFTENQREDLTEKMEDVKELM